MNTTETRTTKPTISCPVCYGTGRNRRGGPCSTCRGRGTVSGAFQMTGALFSALGNALLGLAFAVIDLVILISLIIAAISS